MAMEISSENWKEASIRSIKLAQVIIGRSDHGVELSRTTDPLPLIREACVKESNDRIHAYVRNTRTVVAKLRKSLVATNEEIKSLNRGKEALEKALEHKRKDLALNYQSLEIRTYRPSREKDIDCTDRLLSAEHTHLLTLKKSLESQLRKVQQQLQVLNAARARLSAVIQERSRVTDLLCHSLHSTVHTPIFSRSLLPSSRQSSKHSKSHSAPAVPLGLVALSYRSSSVPPQSARSVSSAGAMVLIPRVGSGHVQLTSEQEQKQESVSGDPYSFMTPEAVQSMTLASDAMGKSQAILQELLKAIDQTQRMQQATHESVNEGLNRKLTQTVTLTQHLQVNAGETSLSANRAQRCLDTQERAQGYLQGPVSSTDITTRERLDRPIVRVFQRHPGTDLPEAGHLVEANDMYCDSMAATRRNITLLKLAGKGLQLDIKDKKTAATMDSAVVRLRRRKVNHRWVLAGSTNRPATT